MVWGSTFVLRPGFHHLFRNCGSRGHHSPPHFRVSSASFSSEVLVWAMLHPRPYIRLFSLDIGCYHIIEAGMGAECGRKSKTYCSAKMLR